MVRRRISRSPSQRRQSATTLTASVPSPSPATSARQRQRGISEIQRVATRVTRHCRRHADRQSNTSRSRRAIVIAAPIPIRRTPVCPPAAWRGSRCACPFSSARARPFTLEVGAVLLRQRQPAIRFQPRRSRSPPRPLQPRLLCGLNRTSLREVRRDPLASSPTNMPMLAEDVVGDLRRDDVARANDGLTGNAALIVCASGCVWQL